MSQSKSIFHAISQVSSQQTGNFTFLKVQVAEWQKLTHLIQPHLPSQGEWRVVFFQSGTLIISGSNQALVSQMRYLHDQYVRNLKAIPALAELERIHITMHSTPRTTHQKYTRKKLLSNETQQELQCAAQMVRDDKLSQALLRLASKEE